MMVDGPGGRPLDVRVSGPEGAPVVLLHHGTPGAPLPMPAQLELGAERGLRHVCYARPGYSGSERAEGRRVADCAADADAVLDAVGADDWLTVGWSGGGPHALACAALLGDRLRAAATLAGVAPSDGEEMDWTGGMGQENLEAFGAARAGGSVLRPYLEGELAGLQTITGPQVAEALGDLIDEEDRRMLHGGAAEALAAMFRDALAPGVDGWLDDDLAFGPWLAARIPGAQPRFDDAHGHVSLVTDDYGAVLDDLLARAA